MIIGICGFAEVGKDTAAQALVDEKNFKKLTFSKAIKDCVRYLNPIIDKDEEGNFIHLQEALEKSNWQELKRNPEVRRLLQNMGTEVGRNVLGQDIWLNLVRDRLHGNCVVTDTRFPNEARLILESGGVLIRVERPGYGPINNHISDRVSESWSYATVLQNDGTPEDLQKKLLSFVSQLETQV